MGRFVKQWVIPVFGAALALWLIFHFYGELDFNQFTDGLSNANPLWIAALAATILLEQLLNGWKWRQVLYDVKPVGTLRLMAALLAGYGANILVPVGISPLVRAWLVARLDDLKMATVLTTTIIARFLDGIVFALFAGVVAIAGRIPRIEGNLQLGLSVAGLLNLILFGGLLWALFRFRVLFTRDGPLMCRLFDQVTARMGANGPGLRESLCRGIVWPRERMRRIAAVLAAVLGKLVGVTHFLWAGLAIGVVLTGWDYLFLMVFAGFSLVIARFVRIPGGFVIGSAYAMKQLGVPDEQALAMILFVHILTFVLVVGIGLVVLWQSGIDIRQVQKESEAANWSGQ